MEHLAIIQEQDSILYTSFNITHILFLLLYYSQNSKYINLSKKGLFLLMQSLTQPPLPKISGFTFN